MLVLYVFVLWLSPVPYNVYQNLHSATDNLDTMINAENLQTVKPANYTLSLKLYRVIQKEWTDFITQYFIKEK